MVSKLGKIARLGIGLGLLTAPLAVAQDNGEFNDRWNMPSYISSQNIQQYNSINEVMNGGERLRDLQPEMRSEYLPRYGHKLERILNEDGQLSRGDRVTVIEAQTPDGIYYPYYLNLDYLDPEKKDLEVIATMVPPEEDKPFRFTLNYHNFEGQRYMTLWNNKDRPGFFQTEGPYPNIAQFILPGPKENYRITSYFGFREDPLSEDTGGAATQYHPAIDRAMADHSNMYGTEILAPMDGIIKFGYIQRENIDDDIIEDEKSSGRYIQFISNERAPVLFEDGQLRDSSVNYTFLHSRAGSEELLRQAMPEGATDWWWIRTLSSELNSDFNEQDLIENIRTNYEAGRLSRLGIVTEWIPVSQGDVIGRVDNTGRENGVHIHYGIRLDGELIDPLEFEARNEVMQDFSLEEMGSKRSEIERILGN